MTSLMGRLAAGTWAVDAPASSARFHARDVLRKPVVGTLPVRTASVQVSPQGSPLHVTAELDLGGVSTGNARRDRDLRGRRFFDVESDGVLRFTAGPARAQDPGHWLLDGQLELRGRRCLAEVAVQLLDVVDGRARVRATASIDRRDAGITVPRLLVGRLVDVQVEAVLLAPG